MIELKTKHAKIVLDEESIHIKILWSKSDILLSDIANIDFDPQAYKKGGFLAITTNKSNFQHSIAFSNEDRDRFTELYNTLNEKMVPHIEERKRKAEEMAERARKLDEEGIAYCPKCTSTSLSVNISTIGANSVMCLKCGHDFHPGK
jgi:hypothetical protein